jgi:hypothetical protein
LTWWPWGWRQRWSSKRWYLRKQNHTSRLIARKNFFTSTLNICFSVTLWGKADRKIVKKLKADWISWCLVPFSLKYFVSLSRV